MRDSISIRRRFEKFKRNFIFLFCVCWSPICVCNARETLKFTSFRMLIKIAIYDGISFRRIKGCAVEWNHWYQLDRPIDRKAAPLTKTVFLAVAHLRAVHWLRTQNISRFRTATIVILFCFFSCFVKNLAYCCVCFSLFKWKKKDLILNQSKSAFKVKNIVNVNNYNFILIKIPQPFPVDV